VQSEMMREPASKRSKRGGSTSTGAELVRRDDVEQTEYWLELSRLYKSLSDYDVLRGIFSSRLGTEQRTREAIEAEMKCDYQAACKIYTQVLFIVYTRIKAHCCSHRMGSSPYLLD